MKTTKTITAGIVSLTNKKRQELQQMWGNYQAWLHGEDREVYSAHKQQAGLRLEGVKDGQEYPIFLRGDLIEVRECDADFADYFFKIPSKQRYGGVWVPIRTGREIEGDLCETKLLRKNGDFKLHITVEREVEEVKEYNGVVGIDLGIRHPVVGATISGSEQVLDVFFLGDSIKEIREKYYYLRRQSDEDWKDRECNRVEDILHKVTTRIADYAKENKLIVAVGDLSRIQDQDRGRVMNRKLHNFPHYRFWQMIEYKCKERGIKALRVDERNTSQTCYKCGGEGVKDKGEFRCGGMKANRDVNGAVNIAQRALTKSEIRSMVRAGAVVAQPEPLSNDPTSAIGKSASGGEPPASARGP